MMGTLLGGVTSPYSPSTPPRRTAGWSLNEFIACLQVLQAQGAGELPVLIETRSRTGAVIFGAANARQDTVTRVEGGYRCESACPGHPVRVVRIG
jgi:hypothetical protein